MKCCIKSCKNSNKLKNADISFHKFPKAEWKREKWMDILGLDKINRSYVVCAKHFHECDFIKVPPGKKKILFPSAMPYLTDYLKSDQPTSSKFVTQPFYHIDMETIVEPNDVEENPPEFEEIDQLAEV